MCNICIISIYFGKLPNYFNLWLSSCGLNPTFNFLLITDQRISNAPTNVKVLVTDLKSIHQRFENAIGRKVSLDKPYKLCDLKPMYGITFADELKEADFWGHCDIDLIWGNLNKFITDDILNKYDKIFPLGHLSLYRNAKNINEAYKLAGSLRGNYEDVISTNKSCVFDERYGINKIFKHNSLPIYEKEVAADIGFRNQRMLIAGIQNRNYPLQIFYVDEGRCMRAYIEDGIIKHDEFAYIHLQKRQYENTVDSKSYIVGPNRFYGMTPITVELIKKINSYRGSFYERFEYLYKDYKFRINRRFKQLFIK